MSSYHWAFSTLVDNANDIRTPALYLCERISAVIQDILYLRRGSKLNIANVLYYAMNALTLVYLLLYMLICWEPDCTVRYELHS